MTTLFPLSLPTFQATTTSFDDSVSFIKFSRVLFPDHKLAGSPFNFAQVLFSDISQAIAVILDKQSIIAWESEPYWHSFFGLLIRQRRLRNICLGRFKLILWRVWDAVGDILEKGD